MCDGGRDHGPRHAARSAQSLLGLDEDVGHVLVLAQEGDVEEDLQRLGVGGHDDELGDAAVEGLGGLIGALTQLVVVGGLLHEVEDFRGQALVGQRVGLGVNGAVSGHVDDDNAVLSVSVLRAKLHGLH